MAWQMRDKNYTRKGFLRDLRTLGIEHRRVRDLRRTFISLAREDGADKVEWRELCDEVAKLRISLPNPAEFREMAESGEEARSCVRTLRARRAGRRKP
jgi:hypothetical protein